MDTGVIVPLCLEGDETFERRANIDLGGLLLLRRCLAGCLALCTVPHVFAEASNLLAQKARNEERLRKLAILVGELVELVSPSRQATNEPAFAYLGLTDAALLSCLRERSDHTLLTIDGALYATAVRGGLLAVNFHHLREAHR